MGVRDTLTRMLGSGSTIPDGVQEGIDAAGMGVDRVFSPGAPSVPTDGIGLTPRSRDYQTGVNISSRPRINEQVSFSTLRGLVKAYDVAQMCIWHRIDSVRSLDWSLVPTKAGGTGDFSKAIAIGEYALRKPDRESSFKSWLAKYMFDILAYDAGALHKMRNGAGKAVGLRVVDGTTIAPLLDYWGNRPEGDAPAFVQFAQGVPWEWIHSEDLVYEPFRPQSNSMYGTAPLESILLNANTDIRFQQFFLNYFTEGNVPEGFAGAPEGWSPDQIKEYQETWDALLYGDDSVKHQLRWVPHGTTFDWAKDATFQENFSLFLMRKTAAAYHVTPNDLGFTEDVNRATGETQADVQYRVGDLPLVEHLSEILSQFLQDDMGLPLQFRFDTGKEVQDRLTTAQANKIYIESGVVSASEVRQNVFGLAEPDGVPVPRFVFTTSAGPIPLAALKAQAGPVDPSTAAPLPGAEAPPFQLVAGVASQEIAKALTSGINETTGAYGSPLLEGEEGPDVITVTSLDAPVYPTWMDGESEPSTVLKQQELRAFSKYRKARVKDGRWRDFTFTTLTGLEAHEANKLARAQVRKAAGQISCAGLCVLAADTGRVLMLQRGLDPNDPAAGMWEFPGGHLEDGEEVLNGALREWCEETGCPPPAEGQVLSQWTSSNGIYQGVVLQVPREADLRINPDTPYVPDPDGDLVETVAWWNPSQLVGNPAVRQELSEDIRLVLSALGLEVSKADWNRHPLRKVDGELLAYHTPKLESSMKRMMSRDEIARLVARYVDA